jgi:Ca2+-binding RTX toxin-like protein
VGVTLKPYRRLVASFLCLCSLILVGPLAAIALAGTPVAVDDESTAFTAIPAEVFVLNNDTDEDFDGLSVTAVTDPANGSASIAAGDQWVIYTSDAAFVGTDTFDYTVSDGTGTDTGTVTVEVAANTAPTAGDDTLTTRINKARTVGVLGNDGDLENQFLTVTTLTPSAAHGDVSCTDFGDCTYTPDADHIGPDSFDYTISDGSLTDDGTVTVDVTANHAPIAVDDIVTTIKDSPRDFMVLENDLDDDEVDIGFLTVTEAMNPSHGSIDLDPSGQFVTFTPEPGYLGPASFEYTVSDGLATDTGAVLITVARPCEDSPGACIDNGVIQLGIHPTGHLNVSGGALSSGNGTDVVGVRYLPTLAEATAPGCLCEGWGAADATSSVAGYANEVPGPGDSERVVNLDVVSFTDTDTTALSITDVIDPATDAAMMRVTHDFHPSTETTKLYEVDVTIQNTSGSPIDARYRRVMDWDIEPTAFSEFVTINTGTAVELLFASDDGFASSNPLAGPSEISGTGNMTDSGPADHGSLFDFGLGPVAPGASTHFTIFYGAAGNEVDALGAIEAVDGEVFSLGQPSTPDGPTLGTPNTFIFAFAGVGGAAVLNSQPVATDDSLTTPEDTPGEVNVLINDTDADPGDVLTVTTGTPTAAHGDVSCTTAGVCTYTPDENYHGSDSFNYTVFDGHTGGTDTGTVNVTVTPVNDDPNAEDDLFTTSAGGAVDVLANDTDVDGDALTITTPAPPAAHGTVTCTVASCTYTPTSGYTGPDSFSYSISDGNGGTDSATVNVTVEAGANQPPDAVNDTATATTEVPESIDVLANDSDPDGDALTVSAVTEPAHGTAVITDGGTTVTYTSDAAYTGADTFDYTIGDGNGGTDTATVNVTVEEPAPNIAPVANDDEANAMTHQAKAINVLGNDTDDNGDFLTITSATDPANGSVVVNESGSSLTYTSDEDFTGIDTFDYTVGDGNGGSDTGTVTVTVENCPLLGSAISNASGLVTGERWIVCSSLTANGTMPSPTPVLPGTGPVGLMTSGDVANAAPPNDSTGKTSNNGETFRNAFDASVLRLTVDVPAGNTCLSMDVAFQSEEYPEFVGQSFNDAFIAELDANTWSVSEESVITAPANFAFGSGSSLVAVNSAFFEETEVITATGTQYDGSTQLLHVQTPITPGEHQIYLTIFDAGDGALDSGAFIDNLATSSSTCTAGANRLPNAIADSFNVPEDSVATPLNVVANDTDPDDGQTLTIASVSTPAHGTATIVDNKVNYTPDADYFGPDSFTYSLTDGSGGVDTATVSVTVTEVNDAPNAVDDSETVAEDGSELVVVRANDSTGPANESGQTLTLGAIGSPAHGTATAGTGADAGKILYTPAANYNGSDSFTYEVCDNGTTNGSAAPLCDTATVTMTVTEVNDAPDAVNDSAQVAEDGSSFVTVLANDTKGPSNESGQSLSLGTIGAPAHGTAVAGTGMNTGRILYTPAGDYNGGDSFTYQICDDGTTNGSAAPLCDTATVTMTVTEVNDAPNAVDDSETVAEDGSKLVVVRANDSTGPANESGQTLTLGAIGSPAHGTATAGTGADAGKILYTPAANYNGSDSFTYEVCDNGTTNGAPASLCDSATVTLTVTSVNDAPGAANDSDSVAEDGSKVVTVLSNDTTGPADESGQTLALGTIGTPAHGTATAGTGADAGKILYTPAANYNGSDSFTYQVCDNGSTNGAPDPRCSQGTVTMTVTEVNDAVVAQDDAAASTSGNPVVIDVRANDVKGPANESGQTLTIGTIGSPGNGTAVLGTGVNAGKILYTSNAGFAGQDTFTYEVCDNGTTNGAPASSCDSATVTVTVSAPPPPDPDISIGNITMAEGSGGASNAVLTVQLSKAADSTVTFNWSTSNGTATAPSDYTAVTSGSGSITLGNTTTTVSVPVVADLLKEPNETFNVSISGVSGADILDGSGTATLTNDDTCTIVGTAGVDALNGTTGNDVLCGLGGNDQINGKGGNDQIIGGDGVDTATYAGAPSAVNVNLSSDTATGWGSDTLSSIENATGSSNNDRLVGDGGANVLNGGSGRDEMFGEGNSDDLIGGDGDDGLRGGPGNDDLSGGDNEDFLAGDAGNDRMNGGGAADVVHYANATGAVTVNLGSGVASGQGSDTIDNVEDIDGSSFADHLFGSGVRNVISGGGGNDDIKGRGGNDHLSAGNGSDHVYGEGGNDTLVGGPMKDFLYGGSGTDTCWDSPGPQDLKDSCEIK